MRSLLIVAGCWLLATSISAQILATLSGQVTLDGEALPGVTITAISQDTEQRFSTLSDESGFYRLQVPPGNYKVISEGSGLIGLSTEVEVQLASATSVDFPMGIELFPEGIVVTGNSSPPRTQVSELGQPNWNSWLAPRDSTGEPVERLEVGESYDFYLDLSRLVYDLGGVSSTEAGAGLVEELLQARVRLTAHVRPVLVGRAVELLGDRLRIESWTQGAWRLVPEGGAAPMEIRLAHLLEDSLTPPPEPLSGADWQQVADRARAGGVRFPVKAIEEACGAITVSIWDESGRIPLDHVVHPVAVGNASCPPKDPESMRSGLLSLLPNRTDGETQAALHLFELADGVAGSAQTVAILVPEAELAGCEHFAWVRTGTLSSYLFKEGAFGSSLRRAWRSGDKDLYPGLARQLRRLLFPRRDDGPCGGWAALDALRQLATKPGQGLFLRLVDPYDRSLFMPLRLLFNLETEVTDEDGAITAQRFFTIPPSLRQPLPTESLEAPVSCVGDWYFLLPNKLHGYAPDLEPPPELADHPGLLIDLEDFRDLVDEWWSYDGTLPDGPAVGLVILAHHVDGVLSTDDADNPWLLSEFDRTRVPRGSVAVLSVCAAGDPTRSRRLVSVLSKAGFDTIILSPFDVYTPFGVDLARHFSRRAVAELTAGSGTRIVDLFDAALDDTVAGLEPILDTRARGMALEFLLAGHSELRLCPKPSGEPEP